MSRFFDRLGSAVFLFVVGVISIFAVWGTARAETYSVLHTFAGYPTDGAWPWGGLVSDGSGNLYGATEVGGAGSCPYYGCGTVFKLAPDGTETILHSFAGGQADGAYPYGSLILDKAGNLYGTTSQGGNQTCFGNTGGCGTIFKIAPNGTETVLYFFKGGSDGGEPVATLAADDAGNFYGTTLVGGGTGCHKGWGCGTVFKLAPGGTETVLYAFTDRRLGSEPWGGVILDLKGTLYGTTAKGGHHNMGIVFRLSPAGKTKILHEFTGASDGGEPQTNLVVDQGGDVFGTTEGGGANGSGTLFEIAPDGTETELYSFPSGQQDSYPIGGLTVDKRNNFLGTTENNYGAVYEIGPSGQETVLHTFANGQEGWGAWGRLIIGKNGRLYGTTAVGGSGNCDNVGCGVVYSLSK